MSTSLYQKIIRDGSPLVIVKDSSQQTARPVLDQMVDTALQRKIRVIYVSYETLQQDAPKNVDNFLYASSWDGFMPLRQIAEKIEEFCHKDAQHLVVIDCINHLLNTSVSSFSVFFGTVLSFGNISILTTFHTDVQLESYPSHLANCETFLGFTATTIMTLKSEEHARVEHEARMRSVPSPLEMDVILKNGQIQPYSGIHVNVQNTTPANVLDELSVPFNLSLSDKQRNDRETVFLPHYAQVATADDNAVPVLQANGGAIIYQADEADDFDEEEDADEDLLL
ncbi:elongator complex subunit Iki1 [Schizosaccharomyces japonicus yFS275]|uniref:Elongator complex protein 5 n=1 Tax=Schizosaccharomyces japonicus (strain yFS275 / FY16936) TaxID=402676 RepID=B6K647_SCHJY|nr:elongator complex subunit Iki1 [Schizosaccharomyces japonicus yFS275]EEB09001.1 elongator complex subunit Iki1 [Schizosaccharomyces japonicus yFS275]